MFFLASEGPSNRLASPIPTSQKDPTKLIFGRVVSVTDGDSLTVLDEDNSKHRIRLAGIDAPETRQALGKISTSFLTAKTFRQNVEVQWDNKDRYGRVIGDIFVDGNWINEEMVAEGWAWHYKEHSDPNSWQFIQLGLAEEMARVFKQGLWEEPNSIPPWEFRKRAAAARR